MSKKVFVGNLSYRITEQELGDLFDQVGNIVDVNIVRRGNRSQGFGFVEYESENAAKAAVDKFDSFKIDDRAINVQLSRPRTEGGNDGGLRRFGTRRGFGRGFRRGGFRGGFRFRCRNCNVDRNGFRCGYRFCNRSVYRYPLRYRNAFVLLLLVLVIVLLARRALVLRCFSFLRLRFFIGFGVILHPLLQVGPDFRL